MADRIRLTLEVSAELNQQLEAMANALDCSKSELLQKAIALIEVGVEAKVAGNQLGVFDVTGRMVTRIVGV